VDLDYLVSDEEEAMWGELVSILIWPCRGVE
jgi:hypothetical protein